jgi:predicted ATPase/DNA-binding CsgD family transcriptional regulator
VQLTSFVGRRSDIDHVSAALRDARLVTLTGPGGSGKTRLALEVADRVRGHYRGSVCFADLSAVRSPESLANALLAALGGREQPGGNAVMAILTILGVAPTLIVLDNCEQVVDAAASLVREVFQSEPTVRVLATSREPLRVGGEAVLSVLPLDEGDAADLFQQRARLVKPGVERLDRSLVSAICGRVDRLPFGIELAASWIDVLPPEELLQRLDRVLSLPERVPGAVEPTHRGLRAAMDWSHDLLDTSERRLLRRLSVLTGGFSLDAADAVSADSENRAESVLPIIARLVDKSLLVSGSGIGGEARFRMLETVREYATEKLNQSGESDRIRRLHFRHFAALGNRARDELHGAHQAEWLDRLDQELENLRAALEWSVGANPARGLKLAGDVGWFWIMHGHYAEGRTRLEALLAAAPDADPAIRAEAIAVVARIAHNQDDPDAVGMAQESLALWRQLGDAQGTARALITFALTVLPEAPTATTSGAGPAPVYEEALELARRARDSHAESYSLLWLGRIASWQGDEQQARRLMEASLQVAIRAGDLWMVAFATDHLGHLALGAGQPADAVAYHERALGIYRQLRDPWGIAHELAYLAASAIALGRQEQAAAYARDCLSVRGVIVREPVAVEVVASLAAAHRDFERALRLHGGAWAMPYLGPRMTTELGRQRWFTAACKALGERAALSAWEAGRRLAPGEVVRAALAAPSAKPGGLSPRELEVAVLVGRGLRNREIAVRLFLGIRTVDAHVEHIRNKLGCRSRSEVAAWVASQGLLDEVGN